MMKLFSTIMAAAGMASLLTTAQAHGQATHGGAPQAGGPVITALPTRPQIDCADYRRQKDGAWTPRKPVVVGGMALTPSMSFTPGVAFNGIDLASLLNARCNIAIGR
jgi:hypothetical protein